MIRVMITDDQKSIRDGYCLLLRREPDIEIVGVARDGKEAVDLVAVHQPHVVLMDVKMPRLDGLKATQQIRARHDAPRVIMVAMSWEDETVRQALDYGACGYVAKTDAFAELPAAIRSVFEGERYFSHRLAGWGAVDWTHHPK